MASVNADLNKHPIFSHGLLDPADAWFKLLQDRSNASTLNLQDRFFLAHALRLKGDNSRAYAVFRRLLHQVDPKSGMYVDILKGLGWTTLLTGLSDHGLDALTKASTIRPRDPSVLGLLALSLEANNDHAKAWKVYKRIEKHHPLFELSARSNALWLTLKAIDKSDRSSAKKWLKESQHAKGQTSEMSWTTAHRFALMDRNFDVAKLALEELAQCQSGCFLDELERFKSAAYDAGTFETFEHALASLAERFPTHATIGLAMVEAQIRRKDLNAARIQLDATLDDLSASQAPLAWAHVLSTVHDLAAVDPNLPKQLMLLETVQKRANHHICDHCRNIRLDHAWQCPQCLAWQSLKPLAIAAHISE